VSSASATQGRRVGMSGAGRATLAERGLRMISGLARRTG